MNWIAQSHIILKCHKLCMTIEREARYELHGIILNVKNRSKKISSSNMQYQKHKNFAIDQCDT